jgi:hypothetical protein
MMDGASLVSPNELARGTQVGGYKIRQRVGTGATGIVYSALDPRSGRKVAVKVLHPHLPVEASAIEPLRERCAALAALHHPGVIAVQEVGRLEAGAIYLISEFALGQPLSDLIAVTGPLAPDEARPLLEALALILATAHGHAFVHGGLTPDNIWITPREGGVWPPMVRVMDFGMAELRQGPRGVRGDEAPYYLSPEQCRGEVPRAASDVYALGVIAYQLLTGRVPFSSERPGEVLRMHLEERARPPSDLAPLAPAVDRFVLRALAKEPAERFQTMLQLRQSLAALDEEWPGPSSRAEAAGGYESYDLQDPRSGGTSGEIPERPGEDAALSPGFAIDAVIVEAATPGWTSPAPSGQIEGVQTAVLPRLERQPARRAPLLAASLGLALAAVLGLGAYRGLVGSWPWGSAATPGAEGQLRVVSTPPGARVRLDEIEQPGTTPLSLRLQQGHPYQITVVLAGQKPSQQTVALALGEEERLLRVELSDGPPRFGTLKLHASVAADFFLDGRKVGTQTRQLTLADVRADLDHSLSVVAPGHKPVRERVRVSSGSTRVLELVLKPISTPPIR